MIDYDSYFWTNSDFLIHRSLQPNVRYLIHSVRSNNRIIRGHVRLWTAWAFVHAEKKQNGVLCLVLLYCKSKR